jgi:pilus assembly protein CpaE
MTSSVALKPDPAPIVACTISRDVQNFDLLIEDMEAELGEKWGDLTFRDALSFFSQPESKRLEFVAVALDAEDEGELDLVGEIIRTAKDKKIKVILIAEDVGPMALHQLLRLGADDFCPYPLPEGALHEAIQRVRTSAANAAAAAAVAIDPETGEPSQAALLAGGGDREGVVLPVHGLAGGVGASTFATNLAWELSQIEPPKSKDKEKAKAPRVCLLDLGLQFGSAATYLDLARRETVYEMLSDTAGLDAEGFGNALQVFNEQLHVLTAPADMLPLDIVTPEDIGRVVAMARRLFDFVVIDMPTTVVPWTETVLSAAHLYFVLLELDMRSAQNTLRFVRALKAEELPHEKLRFVLNRAPKFTDLTGKARVKRMSESLDIKIELQLPDGGPQVAESNDHGLPLSETAAKNPLRKEILKLAASMHALTLAEAVAAE